MANILLIVCILIFLGSGARLYIYYQQNQAGDKEYKQLSTHIYIEETSPDPSQINTDKEKEALENLKTPVVDISALSKINSDFSGWLYLPDTDISYPVVYGDDNEFYLHNTFEKKANASGAIFLDADNKDGFVDKNSIIYGHNMKNGSMFGKLRSFTDQDYVRKHPYFWIVTAEGSYLYEIFAVYKTDASSSTYQIEFDSSKNFMDYIKMCMDHSYYKNDLIFNKQDSIVTLSTCTNASDQERLVVQGKRIEER